MARRFRTARRRFSKLFTTLAVETQILELRSLPAAGNVVAVFSGNTLFLTGDNADNNVEVDLTASGLEVTGHNGTTVKVGSVVHASDDMVTFQPSGAIGFVANMNLGNDGLAINIDHNLGAKSIKQFAINMGADDDQFSMSVGTGTTLNFSSVVSILTGEGNDQIDAVIAGTVVLEHALTVDTGIDNDRVNLDVDGTLTEKSTASFTTGDGQDALTLQGAGVVSFASTLTIDTGEDSDTLNVNLTQGMTVKALTTITTGGGDDVVSFSQGNQSALSFQKGLSIDTGAGADSVVIHNNSGTLSVGTGNLSITTGSGNDQVDVAGKLVIASNVSIDTGDGQDHVSLATQTGVTAVPVTPVASQITGSLNITTGSDNDTVAVTVSPHTALTITKGATIKTGLGDDSVSILHQNTALIVATGLSIDTTADATTAGGATATSTASGADSVTIDGGQQGLLSVTGSNAALQIATGAGDDQVNISDALVVSGNMNLDTGTGADTVQVKFENGPSGSTAAAATILGLLTINTGDGEDTVGLLTDGAGTVQINGNTSITSGNGTDTVSILASANLLFAKSLAIDTGLNDDVVDIEAQAGSIHIKGSETIALGDDNDTLIQGTAAAIAPFVPATPNNSSAVFQIDTNLTITGGVGTDVIGLAGFQVGKDPASPGGTLPSSLTSIDAGTGDDIISATGLTLRDLRLQAGDGNDTIEATDVIIRGTTSIDLGAGNDLFSIDGVTAFNGNVTISGKAGDDGLAIGDSITLAAGKKIALDGGTGTNAFANSSSISNVSFSPAPVKWPAGTVDTTAIHNVVFSAFQSALAKAISLETA